MEQGKFNVVIGREAKVSGRDGVVFLKFAGEDGNKIKEETIWEGRKSILWAWKVLTENPKVEEEVSKALSLIHALDRYMYLGRIKLNSLFLELAGWFAPFDFKGFSGSVLVSGLRLFEERKKAGERLGKELLDELKKDEYVWRDFLFHLKKFLFHTDDEEQALKEFSEFLKKWEDKDFLAQLRADWKEVLKKLIKRVREEFLGAYVQRGEVIGNVSYLKEQKGLRFKVEGFGLSKNRSVYVIVEKPSASFEYELYMVEIEGQNVSMYLREKTIEERVLRKWIEEGLKKQDTWFCFITAGKQERSFLKKLITYEDFEDLGRKKIFAQYSELPIHHISEEARKDCFVIYTDDFDTLKGKLKIKEEKREASLAIKPAFSNNLQVYITEGVGWEAVEVYSEMRTLFLLSVISLSLYNSEPSVVKSVSQTSKPYHSFIFHDGTS